jgi:PAS domain S-box-containing protein
VSGTGDQPPIDSGRPPAEIDPVALLASLPDPVVVVSAEATLVWANDAAEELFGWSRDDAIGWDASELVHPDDLATAVASLNSVQEKRNGTLIEIRVRDRSGSYRRIEVRGRPAPDLGGVVLALRDVTERRRWELLEGDAAGASAVFDALPTIAFVLEPDGRLRSANRAFTRLLGHDLESSLGRPLTDFVSVAKVLAVADAIEEVAGGRPRSSRSSTSPPTRRSAVSSPRRPTSRPLRRCVIAWRTQRPTTASPGCRTGSCSTSGWASRCRARRCATRSSVCS